MPFQQLDPQRNEAEDAFEFEGCPVPFQPGQTLAGALMAVGTNWFRLTPVSGTRRGPWCLMGICYECLLRVDGQDNVRACVTLAEAGMVVERQAGPRRDAAESSR